MITDLKYLFKFSDEENLFCCVGDGPYLEEVSNNLLSKVRVLLKELDYATLQLGVESAEVGDLVERKQTFFKEKDVIVFERSLKSIDNGAQYFQELRYAIVLFVLIGDLNEEVHH